MPTRIYHYAESLSRSTTTNTSYTAKTSVTFTPNANKEHLVIWSAIADVTPSGTWLVRLYNVTNATQLSINNDGWWGVSLNQWVGGCCLFTSGASPSETTIQIQYAANSGFSTGLSEATILVLELGANDAITEVTATQSTSSATFVDSVTVNFSPPSAGSYLIIASADFPYNVDALPGFRLFNGTAGFSEIEWSDSQMGMTMNFIASAITGNISGAQTWALQVVRMEGPTNAAQCLNRRICALRLSDFDGAFLAEDRTSHATTSATYADSASANGTPAAVPHWVFACGLSQADDAGWLGTTVASNRLATASGAVGSVFPSMTTGQGRYNAWAHSLVRTEDGFGTIWKTQYARSSGTVTVYSDENVVAALQLEASGPSLPTQSLYPDAILASTNLTGAVTDIDDNPSSPDANWLTATNQTTATECRVSFPTPAGAPSGAQNFRYYLRKTAGTNNPTIVSELRQNNTLRATLENGVAVSSTTGELHTGNWNASSLATVLDGSDVELRIASTIGAATTLGALPAYNAVGTAESNATMPATFDVAIPTHSSGDLLILHVLTRNTNNNGTLASINTAGWTQGGGAGTAYGGSNNARSGFGWKIGDGSETVVNVTTTGGTGTDRRLSRVYRFTATNGFAASNAVRNIGTATAGSGTSASMPTVSTTSGANMLAVALISSAVSTTVAAATGETGGNWTEPVAESAGTNGTIAIQVSDQSAASSISGGTAVLGTTGNWVVIGFAVVPLQPSSATTVEIGAIEWNVQYTGVGAAEQPFMKRLRGVPFMSTTPFVW